MKKSEKISIKHPEINENKKLFQNWWDAGKAVLKGKFIATQTYLMKKKIHINSLTLYLKYLEKRKSPKLVEGRNQYRSEYK